MLEHWLQLPSVAVKYPDGHIFGQTPLTKLIGHWEKQAPWKRYWPAGQEMQMSAEPKQAAHENEQY